MSDNSQLVRLFVLSALQIFSALLDGIERLYDFLAPIYLNLGEAYFEHRRQEQATERRRQRTPWQDRATPFDQREFRRSWGHRTPSPIPFATPSPGPQSSTQDPPPYTRGRNSNSRVIVIDSRRNNPRNSNHRNSTPGPSNLRGRQTARRQVPFSRRGGTPVRSSVPPRTSNPSRTSSAQPLQDITNQVGNEIVAETFTQLSQQLQDHFTTAPGSPLNPVIIPDSDEEN